jgi:hypothetical protein
LEVFGRDVAEDSARATVSSGDITLAEKPIDVLWFCHQRFVGDWCCRPVFPIPGSLLRGAAIKPSRCARLRASLRARRIDSLFSRAVFSDGFS